MTKMPYAKLKEAIDCLVNPDTSKMEVEEAGEIITEAKKEYERLKEALNSGLFKNTHRAEIELEEFGNLVTKAYSLL